MLFSSLIFISVFLPLVLLSYYLTPRSCRNYTLLLFSMLFYLWGDASFFNIMFSVIVVNYFGAIILDLISEERRRLRKITVMIFILGNLGFLIYFKYFNFIVLNIQTCFGFEYTLKEIILPLGISFYLFQGLSYLIDVYRKDIPVQRNFLDLALFISFFPQLIAGPILKYHDVQKELECRRETLEHLVYGARRFIIGLGKKVILANSLGYVADQIFGLPVESVDSITAWGGAIAYSLQLFFDFSGYSDMAIGLGAMFGFHFLENFNYPYISRSITEFWRRWHISLSTWFKEYLYIPLGGNRVSRGRNIFNLFVVFLATGIWHGAAWNFVVWGLLHGFFIIFEKLTGWNKTEGGFFNNLLHRIYLLLVVLLAWVFFRAEDLSYAVRYVGNMFGLIEAKPVYNVGFFFSNWVLVIAAIAILTSTDIGKRLYNKYLSTTACGAVQLSWRVFRDLFCLAILLLSMTLLASSTYNPFIYFRF